MTAEPLRATRLLLRVTGLALLTSICLGCRGSAPDELILRTGGTLVGQLTACNTSQCILSQAVYSRPAIEWIGFGNGQAAPPSSKTGDLDELYLKDGSVHAGKLVAVTPSTVTIGAGSFDRARVAFVHLAGAPVSAQGATEPSETETSKTDKKSPPNYYVWDGSVIVQNKFNGLAGRHDWASEYRLKMCELPQGDWKGPKRRFIQIELAYTFHADHDWDGPYNEDGKGEQRYDEHYHGMSTGKVSREAFDNRTPIYVTGLLWHIDTSQPPVSVPESFAKLADHQAYWKGPDRLGRYNIDVVSQDPRLGKDSKWPAIIYAGIRHTGRGHPDASHPNHDFTSGLPYAMRMMPRLSGYISDPDQEDVNGAFSYPFTNQHPRDSPEMISVKWSFKRTKTSFASPSDADKWARGEAARSQTWCR